MNNNILPEKIEYKPWFIQHPLDEQTKEPQSITLEVPVVTFPSKTNNNAVETIDNGITCKEKPRSFLR